ncbi:GAF domain-containing sensor histidine kinase [Rhodocytophaga rosea]|uniref:histidine kinase n=1 Tax=Rhodocytophaga rosea TaxID=2704465 RepID=A0A6C0GKW1_9BACT|nr:GAF domain-containing sensor histidine kinase [Rhodocytophaga rosea]QHT68645.1 GAF domain-containing sensor histidine kinase [Rhodocytophaga rosea]
MENIIKLSVSFKELEAEKRKNEIIRQLSLELSKTSILKEKLDNILAILDHSLGLKHTMLLLPDDTRQRLKVFSSRGFDEQGIGAEVNVGQGIIGVVALKKKKLRMANISRSRTYMSIIAQGSQLKQDIFLPSLSNAESQVALPLLVNDELIAVLSAESADLNFFSLEDEEFLMTLSQLMAHSIQNAIILEQLEQKVQERTAALEKQKQELEKANASKDRLFAIIGHDLRNPAAALQHVAELIQYFSKKGDTQKVIETGNNIVKEAKTLNCIIDNLLNWSITQTGDLKIHPEEICLDEIVKEVIELYDDIAAAKNIQIQVNNPDCLAVFADRNATHTVLRNLVSNAIKFTRPGGNIIITAIQQAQTALITVKDDGVGILPEHIPALFDLKENKSTRGTAKEKGTGLGLVLVKEMVKLNGGEVSITSIPNEGTTVYLLLPGISE